MRLVLLFCLSFIIYAQTWAQENKGKFFIETGVKLVGGETSRTFVGKTGISFYQYKHEFESITGEKDSYETLSGFSYSIAPRVGYFLGERFLTGFELQYHNNNYWVEYHHYTGGIFARYYFLSKKFSPFLEVGLGLGRSKEIEDSMSSGGGKYQKITVENLNYFNGSAGVCYSITQKFDLNFALKIQQTVQKFNDKSNYSTHWYQKSTFELVPFLSFCYYFN